MITPDDAKLAKTAIEAATSEALRPFADLITKLFGPASEEIGLGLRAGLTVWRMKRQVRFWKQTQKFLLESGIEPSPVPPKMLLPIIQNAALEDSDELQDRWAALLANASNPDSTTTIHPSFSDKLRQLSPIDAKILDWIYDEGPHGPLVLNRIKLFAYTNSLFDKPDESGDSISRRYSDLRICLQNCENLGLIKFLSGLMAIGDTMPVESVGEDKYEMTDLGKAFIKACRAPSAKATPKE